MLIWLASYPRSGNTFLRVILNRVFDSRTYSIYNDPMDIGADQKTQDLVGHVQLPEGFDLEEARQSSELFIVKTHHPPENDSDAAIYIARDGRESSISYANYSTRYGAGETVQKELVRIVCGLDEFGSWGQHVYSWSPDTRKNTLLIRFEELTADPDGHLESIAEFIGLPVHQHQIPNFAHLQQVNSKFFRRGSNDSWKEEFSEDLHTLFWLKNHAAMLRLGYRSDMPEVLTMPEVAKIMQATLVERNQVMQTAYYQTSQAASALGQIEARLPSINGDANRIKAQVAGVASDLQQALAKTVKLLANQLEPIDFDYPAVPKARLFPDVGETLDMVAELLEQAEGKQAAIDELQVKSDYADRELKELRSTIGELDEVRKRLESELLAATIELEKLEATLESTETRLLNQTRNLEQGLNDQTETANALKKSQEKLEFQIEEIQALNHTLDNIKQLAEEFVRIRAFRSPVEKYHAYRTLAERLRLL